MRWQLPGDEKLEINRWAQRRDTRFHDIVSSTRYVRMALFIGTADTRQPQMIFRVRKSRICSALWPGRVSTSALSSPSSGAMPIRTGASEKCHGLPCSFSFFSYCGYST